MIFNPLICMLKKYFAALTLISLLALPLTTHAATFLVDENALSLTQDIEDDVYAAAQTVFLNREITGDVAAAGKTVSIAAPVSQDVYAAGETVEVTGAVADDVAVAGNIVTLAAATDDLFAAGSQVKVTKEAQVAGDAYLAGERVELAGKFSGNVRVSANTVTVRSGAVIEGNLTTFGGSPPVVESGATIRGQQQHRAAEPHTPQRRARVLSFVTSVLTWFVAAQIMLYVFPTLTAATLARGGKTVGRSLLTGLIWLILFIPVSILLAMTVIGLPLMVALLCVTGLLIVAALAVAPVVIGKWVMQRVLKVTTPLSWQHVLVGAVIFAALGYLPIIGALLCSLLVLWTLGALIQAVWYILRSGTDAPTTPAV